MSISPVNTPKKIILNSTNEESKKPQVARSQIPPSGDTPTSIHPNLKTLKKKSTLPTKKNLSLSKLGLHKDSSDLLKKFASSTSIGQRLSPLENMVQFVHYQMNLLEKGLEACFPGKSYSMFKNFKDLCYQTFFVACANSACKLYDDNESQKLFSLLFKALKDFQQHISSSAGLVIHQGNDHQTLSKEELITNKEFTEQLNALKKNVLDPVEELKRTFSGFQKIYYQLSDDDLYSLFITTPTCEISEIKGEEDVRGYSLKKTVSNFKQLLLNFRETVKEDSLVDYIQVAEKLVHVLEAHNSGDNEKVLTHSINLFEIWERISSRVESLREKLHKVSNDLSTPFLLTGDLKEALSVGGTCNKMFHSYFRIVWEEVIGTCPLRASGITWDKLRAIWEKRLDLSKENSASSEEYLANDLWKSMCQRLKEKTKKNLSFLPSSALSEEMVQVLKRAALVSQYGKNLSPIENIVQSLQRQVNLLEAEFNKHFTGEENKTRFKKLKDSLYRCFYSICYNTNSKFLKLTDYALCIQSLEDLKNKVDDKFKTDDPQVIFQSSNKGKQANSRLKEKRKDETIKSILEPIEEIKKTMEGFQKISSALSENELYSFLTSPTHEIEGYVEEKQVGNFSGYSLKETVKNFKEFLENVLERSCNKEPLFLEHIKLADQLFQLLDTQNPNEEKILEHYITLTKIWERIYSSTSFLIKMNEDNIFDKEIKENALPIENKAEAMLVTMAFFDMSNTYLKLICEEIGKSYPLQLSETACIDLHVIKKKLSFLAQENASTSVSSSLEIFAKEFEGIIKKPSLVKHFKRCTEKIPECMKAFNESQCMACFNELNQAIPSLVQVATLKEKTKKLKKEVADFKSIMKSFVQALQKELNQLENNEVQELKKIILKFKSEVSPYLAPILSLPAVLDRLIYNPKEKKVLVENLYKVTLEDDINDLFNLMFKKPIKEKVTKPALAQASPDQKPKDNKQILSPAEQESQSDHPQSSKTSVIFTYLKEKGWSPSTVKGDHLKLNKKGHILMLPISPSKDHIPKGTLGRIFRNLNEKEDAMKNPL